MLVEILIVLLVVVVAALMVVDVVRSQGEGTHGHADGQAHGVTYPITAAARGDRGEVFHRQPAATGIPNAGPAGPVASAGPAVSTARAASAGQAVSAGQAANAGRAVGAGPNTNIGRGARAGQAASTSASADNDPRSHVGSAADPGLHGKLNAMFVNLSHRSQTLVERQIRLLQILEQGEKDPERQAILFRLDRIATRMHRNSENLLILAGQEPSNNWNQPVALANLIRVAVSEVEESQRVSLNAHPDIAIVGSAVNDVVHLLAELIENATSFSAADMRVDVSGRLLTSGGLLLEITDQGIGMTPKELAHANWRLENPPTGEINVPKWIGLFVVARLAARHGVGVRLQPAEVGGLTALVWLPNELLTQPGTPAAPRFSDFGAAGTGPAGPAGTGIAGTRRGLHEADSEPGYATVGRTAATARFTPRSPEPNDAMGQHAGVSSQPARNSAGVPARDVADGNVGTRLGSTGPGGTDTSQVAAAPPGTAAPVNQETSPEDGVIVPSAEGRTEKRGLPIFSEVESRWFRDGRDTPAAGTASTATESRWSSPVDAGWRAAQAADSPSSAGSTAAGLPRRPPNANLIPGAVPSMETVLPSRSAAAARERLAGLQRGIGEGRAAAKQAASSSEEEGSAEDVPD
jgi:hypothetical protein